MKAYSYRRQKLYPITEEKLDEQMAELRKRKQTFDLHGPLSWCYAGKCKVPGCNRTKYCDDCGKIIKEEWKKGAVIYIVESYCRCEE